MSKLNAVVCALFISGMLLQIAVNHSMITEIRANRYNIQTLERIVDKQSRVISDMRTRVTRLERPDEPVYPPRHPGRIGTIDSNKVGSIDP